MLIKDANFRPSSGGESVSAAGSRNFSLRDILMVLFRRKRIVVLVFCSVSIFGALAAVWLEDYRVYVSRHTIKIVPPGWAVEAIYGSDSVPEDLALRKDALYEEYLILFENSSIYHRLERMDVDLDETEGADGTPGEGGAEGAKESRKWKRIAEYERDLWESDGQGFLKNRLRAVLGRWVSDLTGLDMAKNVSDESMQQTARWRLKSGTRVQLVRGARSLMELRFTSPYRDPELTAEILERVLDAVEDEIRGQTAEDQVLALADQKIAALEAECQELANRRLAFLGEHGLIDDDLAAAAETRREQVTKLEERVDELSLRIAEKDEESSFATQRAQVARRAGSMVPEPPRTRQELEIDAIRMERVERLREKAWLRKAPENVNLKRIAQIDEYVVYLDEEIQRLEGLLPRRGEELPENFALQEAEIAIQQIAARKENLVAQRTRLKESLEQRRSELDSLLASMRAGEGLLEEHDLAHDRLRTLRRTRDNLSRQRDLEKVIQTFDRTVTEPTIARGPFDNSRMRLGVLLGGIFFGLAAGIGLAFVRDLMDRSVKSVDEVEELLGVPVIASVPRNRRFRKLLR